MTPSRRPEAHKAYAAALSAAKGEIEVRAVTRELALRDLFFLLVYVLGRKDVDRDWLFERCGEVKRSPDGHLDLWARDHYKSSILTFGLTIQDILNDPEVTFGLFSHTRPIAKGFMRQIKREFERNALLKQLFPDILWENPQKEAPKWSEDDGIVVKRKTNPKEATIEAWGLVEGQPTSKHFRKCVYDDVVVPESVTTSDMIRKTTAAWELSLNLGTADGVRRYVGTRYHFNDTYATILERKAAVPRIYPCTVDGTMEGEPALLTREALINKRREMGPYTYACQMMLDPRADATQGFRKEWLRVWVAQHTDGLNIYIVCDPANEKKKDSDYTVFWVLGLGADRNYYVITMVRDRLSLPERWQWLLALHQEFNPVRVGYEQYGMQADIAHFKEEMKRLNYRFPIIPLGGNMPKPDRIKRLIPIFEQGRLFLPDMCWRVNYEGQQQDLSKIFIDEEYMAFPVATHDDMLDGLARIVDGNLGAAFPRTGRAAHRSTTADRDYNPHAA